MWMITIATRKNVDLNISSMLVFRTTITFTVFVSHTIRCNCTFLHLKSVQKQGTWITLTDFGTSTTHQLLQNQCQPNIDHLHFVIILYNFFKKTYTLPLTDSRTCRCWVLIKVILELKLSIFFTILVRCGLITLKTVVH